LEQAAADASLTPALAGDDSPLHEILTRARRAYRRLIDKLQPILIKHVETAGWPPPGRLANADVFDKLVAPRLKQSGHRVALILVDALRYELGVELQKQLAAGNQVDLTRRLRRRPRLRRSAWPACCPTPARSLPSPVATTSW
jgi:hypothetical protein